jgi:hypothetical protein
MLRSPCCQRLDVSFQYVVHPALTGEADVVETSILPGGEIGTRETGDAIGRQRGAMAQKPVMTGLFRGRPELERMFAQGVTAEE